MPSEKETSTTADESTADEAVPTGTSSRRDLVTKGAVAAAVAAVAGGALSSKVHAANGSIMHVGQSDTGTLTTRLSGGTSFRVDDGTSYQSASIYGSAKGKDGSLYGIYGSNVGDSDGGAGVYGTYVGSQGHGVHGENSGGGNGVYGEHTGTSIGDGVSGMSASGYGVRGNGGRADFLASGSGKIIISNAAAPGPTASGSLGTIARDASGALWYCYATNKWRELAGASSAGAFHAIVPARIYDSRSGFPPAIGPQSKLNPSDASRVIDCTANASGVPSTATAVVLNLTVANTTGLGNLRVYPNGAALPPTSSINYTPGVNIANTTTSGCGPGAKLAVKAGGSSGADFIMDIVGYYV